MKIDHLRIHNYKSLVDFELINPNPFTVFVGPNASGKSNIFEALEFLSYITNTSSAMVNRMFDGLENYLNKNVVNTFEHRNNGSQKTIDIKQDQFISFSLNHKKINFEYTHQPNSNKFIPQQVSYDSNNLLEQFTDIFSRIFVGRHQYWKIKNETDSKLNIDASNLELVLQRLLKNDIIREELLEIFELLIPEFEDIKVVSNQFSEKSTLLVKEKYSEKYYTKNLLSDGTINIIALFTALYQSDQPQFLCIEEPENGLNPYVVEELIEILRNACKDEGHTIWLNSHSQTIARHLQPHEMILIDKKEGITRPKQVQDFKLHGLTMDEAWLSNAIGGGLPW